MANQTDKRTAELDSTSLARYDWRRSYDWNYENAPAPVPLDEPTVPGTWTYCGLPVGSPLGIAAGPLLNGSWILYYASLGFDVLTYKTVRSRARACYAMPNLQPVNPASVRGADETLSSCPDMRGSWAVSFGMPSKSPEVWRADVAATRRALPRHKILSVSVVATPDADWTLDDVAEDFARCASWAIESGADCVEANFSCPNVASQDGQLYHQPEAASVVAARLRQAVGNKPLLIKIGHVTEEATTANLCAALAPHANALVMVNCIAAKVVDASQRPLFDGERRGIAGEAIGAAVLDQVRLFAGIIHQFAPKLQIVSGGGIATVQHVSAQFEAGSKSVQLATSPMIDPGVGIRIRRALASGEQNAVIHPRY